MRLILAIGLGFLIACAAGCGGGSGGSSYVNNSGGGSGSGTGGSGTGTGSGSGTGTGGGSPPTQVIASAAPNVASIVVDCGPASLCGSSYPTVNLVYVTVTICPPGGTTTCQTFDHVQVDNQSYGLRILAEAQDENGNPLASSNYTAESTSGNAINECAVFADGYSFGPVVTADVKIPTNNGTSAETASGVPVQIIANDPTNEVPADCQSQGLNEEEGTVVALGANGILGIGPFVQDCGANCVAPDSGNGGSPPPASYYACSQTGGGCTLTFVTAAQQVSNPVSYFQTDNNGEIIELPSVPASGAATATGALVFGIGTEGNNDLGSASIFEASTSDGSITTTYKSQTLDESILDSGSNGLFFTDSSISQCTTDIGFYCPSATLSLSATNSDSPDAASTSGVESTVDFSVANAEELVQTDTAFNDLAGTLSSSLQGSGVFDWGLPFFFGRNVFTAIAGANTPAGQGPYFAY